MSGTAFFHSTVVQLLAIATLAGGNDANSCERVSGTGMITAFSISPASAEFGEPVPNGAPVSMTLHGQGDCRADFRAGRGSGGRAAWRIVGTAEGGLPLSSGFVVLPSGDYLLGYESDCHDGKFRREIRVRVRGAPP